MDHIMNSLNFREQNNQSSKMRDRDNYEKDSKKIYSNNEIIGDVTGAPINNNFEKFELGMPIRSNYTIKQSEFDANMYSDFSKKNNFSSNLNIKSFDPSSDFADIEESMSKISTQMKPVTICSDEITKIAVINFLSLKNAMGYENTFGINSLGLYSGFSYIYGASDSLTELELKKYFSYPEKNILIKGMNSILNEINMLDSIFNMKNILLVDGDYPCSSKYTSKMQKFATIVSANTNNKNKQFEADKINNYLTKFTGLEGGKKIISISNLTNLNSILINTLNISPVWEYEFDEIIQDVFAINSDEYYMMSFLKGNMMSFDYYEDDKIKMI